MPSFAIGADDFLLDGRPFRVLSGALHYFRVHPDLWADRIHKARLLGLNTIETYVAWNAHEAVEGRFDLGGGLDLRRFLELVAAEGMYAIVRPGPYICAEWDNGGLPAWLFRDSKVGVRRFEPRFLAAVERYFARILPIVAELQIDRGGPVILVQVENEYGAYGSDKLYLQALTDLTRAGDITVPLTTIDQPTDRMLEGGSLPGLHLTASFGSRATDRLETLRQHQSTGPLMCAEFWDGWFDNWGAHHHTTSAADAARELDDLLAAGASVNLYMFHGGTNFGFTNGANDKGTYEPIVTSYDYDAPLDEAGHPTEKYWAFREVIARYAPVPGVESAGAASEPSPAGDAASNPAGAASEPSPAGDAASNPAGADAGVPAFEVPLGASVPLSQVVGLLGEFSRHPDLPTMDDAGQYSGFALYRVQLPQRSPDVAGARSVLTFAEVRDRAQVFVDGSPGGVLSRDQHDTSISIPVGARLEVLVEDQGRVNYGDRIGEPKGLIGPATLDGEPLGEWDIAPLDLGRIEEVAAVLRQGDDMDARLIAGPSFALAEFDGSEGTDLFFDTRHWGKGVVWINGFNLGRYWSRGPQHTLVVPGPLVRDGRNEVMVLELTAIAKPSMRFVRGLDLGHTES
ncbi:beta-galactosidase [Marisediminicola sp. UYEF4]|uniref:glycoside hydrolase family 35 protein n=1 Tax=Marisediminicola sp. UYEF4 TaxID=1756384 RepID=UPI003395E788